MTDEKGMTGDVSPPPKTSQSPRVERAKGRVKRQAPVTNGTASGTNGGHPDLGLGSLICAITVAGFALVNAPTVLSDQPHLPIWAPWTWESTSAVGAFVSMPLVYLGTRLFPLARLNEGWAGRAVFGLGHLAMACAYCLIHVSTMVSLRHGLYGLMGRSYDFGPLSERLPYEFRKDIFIYALFAIIFWAVKNLREARETPVRPVSFDIRDGARLIRAPLDDILAVTSAGNYVEFVLKDGRRPLMRVTLAAIEAELDRCGFVRTHRSWLVNARCLTALTPQGSGDYQVELGSLQVPLSRRYGGALARLTTAPNTP